MTKEITIKDVPKKKVVYITGKDQFSLKKATEVISKVLFWLVEKGAGVTDLPLALINQDKTFKICVPIKENLKEEKEYKIEILPAHRMGIITHQDFKKPLSISEDFLVRQIKYEGFKISWPRRYLFHQNPKKAEEPIIEIRIPIHK